MKDVLPVALFDGAPMVLGEVVRPESAEKTDHAAAFECGDHQADGSVRKVADIGDFVEAVDRAEARTGLSGLFICMSVCEQLGLDLESPFPKALFPQAIVLADQLTA